MDNNNSSELRISKLNPEEIESYLSNKYGSKLLSIDYGRSKKSHLQFERTAPIENMESRMSSRLKTTDENIP